MIYKVTTCCLKVLGVRFIWYIIEPFLYLLLVLFVILLLLLLFPPRPSPPPPPSPPPTLTPPFPPLLPPPLPTHPHICGFPTQKVLWVKMTCYTLFYLFCISFSSSCLHPCPCLHPNLQSKAYWWVFAKHEYFILRPETDLITFFDFGTNRQTDTVIYRSDYPLIKKLGLTRSETTPPTTIGNSTLLNSA